MPLIPFSKRYPNEFLSREEDNFEAFIEKLRLFYNTTRPDIQDGTVARRNLSSRFDYQEELSDTRINQKGLSTQEVAEEFNDILQGCIRHQDPTTAFNIIPPSLLASVAGMTLASLYNPNTCWDFISGKFCLYEKKITKMLGSLVGWPQAEGFVVTGGKQALAYAIKNGIGRANLNASTKMSDYVVICSELAHYSIEHVCHYLGISPENCVHVASNSTGEMNLRALDETLQCVISQNKRIAAVIAVAGGTINLVPDPILLIRKRIDLIVKSHQLDYTPYLHVDSVITWAWLAFENKVDFPDTGQVHPNVMKKIHHVRSKLSGIKYADSFAADFHKTGFCPYDAGVFIAKEASDLSGLTPNQYVPRDNPRFGEVEPFKQTFENSRSSLSIAAIWIALRKMGLEGLRQFILYQLEVCELFTQKIQENYSDHFEVINSHSNGWEIVLKPHFAQKASWDQLQESSAAEQQDYTNDCYAFLNDLWYGPLEGENRDYPVIGFVRKYSRHSREQSFPAFLIHPTSPHYDENAINEMLEKICTAKALFEQKRAALVSSSSQDYLSEMTPPR